MVVALEVADAVSDTTADTITLLSFATAGTNRLLLCSGAARLSGIPAFTSMTRGGTEDCSLVDPPGQVTNQNDRVSNALYEYHEPATAAANIVFIVSSSVTRIGVGAWAFSGVDQTIPVSDGDSNEGDGVESLELILTTAANDYAAGAISLRGQGTGMAIATGDEDWNLAEPDDDGGGSDLKFGGASDLATGASTTLGWSWTTGTEVVLAGCRVNAATGGGAANPKGPLGMPLHGPFGGPL